MDIEYDGYKSSIIYKKDVGLHQVTGKIVV